MRFQNKGALINGLIVIIGSILSIFWQPIIILPFITGVVSIYYSLKKTDEEQLIARFIKILKKKDHNALDIFLHNKDTEIFFSKIFFPIEWKNGIIILENSEIYLNFDIEKKSGFLANPPPENKKLYYIRKSPTTKINYKILYSHMVNRINHHNSDVKDFHINKKIEENQNDPLKKQRKKWLNSIR